MKQIRISILVIVASITLCACPQIDGGPEYIKFVNKSDKRIACQEYWSGSITNADTLYHCHMLVIGIGADSAFNFESLNESGWKTDFKLIPYIQFLVMDAETFGRYKRNCDTIRKYVPILHRYQLTLEDLQRMNWTVTYPPEK